MSQIAKSHYIMALACYLAIPASCSPELVCPGSSIQNWLAFPPITGGNFRLLEMAATGALMATTGLALVFGAISYYLVLKPRQRSLLWLALGAAGPFGFMFIAMLADRSPALEDLYQQFIRKLKLYRRIPLEIAVFVSAWVLAYQCMVLKRNLLISFESASTGAPVETIIARQNASSGMYAFGEGLK